MDAPFELHNPFWHFSLAVYARPGVAEECLAAQSALGLDVNVLLFCAWVGAAKGITLEPRQIEAHARAVRAWQQSVVEPLRAARQSLKTMPAMAHAAVRSLREEIAADELRAEQIEQALLFAGADPAWPASSEAPAKPALETNVRRYLEMKGGGVGVGHVACARLIEAAQAVGNAAS